MPLRFAVKLNRNILPRVLHYVTPSAGDPRRLLGLPEPTRACWSEAVSSIWTGGEWKTTWGARHPGSNENIRALLCGFHDPIILDVGMSDGSTTLDLVECLNGHYGRYYATDKSLSVLACRRGRRVWFYHPASRLCFMRAGPLLLLYGELRSSFPFIDRWAREGLRKAPDPDRAVLQSVDLVQPGLRRLERAGSGIEIFEWDLFDTWRERAPQVVKVGNVLNHDYFSEERIMSAIRKFRSLLADGGYLVVVENRKQEQWTVVQKCGEVFEHVRDGSAGSDIRALMLTA
jgi:hypothetical protein